MAMMARSLIVLVSLAVQCNAFSLPATRLAQQARGAFSRTTAGPACEACVAVPAAIGASCPAGRSGAVTMGLFGLGWAEIGIIGVIALFIFGPDRLIPLARDLGKQSVGLKEITDSFSEGMSEGEKMPNLKSADAEDPPKLGQAKAKKEEK